jgi:putative transposase
MRKSKYSESQINQTLNERESDMLIRDLSREHGISRSAYYKWKAKYGGMDIQKLKHL